MRSFELQIKWEKKITNKVTSRALPTPHSHIIIQRKNPYKGTYTDNYLHNLDIGFRKEPYFMFLEFRFRIFEIKKGFVSENKMRKRKSY